MSKYFLESERIGFKTWTSQLQIQAQILWCNPQVTEYIGGVSTKEQIAKRIEQEIANLAKYKVQYWPIYLKDGNRFLGCCGLRPYDVTNNTFEIGFHILPEFWRMGLGSEAAYTTISYAFDILGIQCLFAGHNPENKASANLLFKIGFKYSHDEFYPPTGLNHPSYFLERK